MNVVRAQQILESDAKIEVKCNGDNVWIESIDTRNMTAQVHPEGVKADSRTVELDQLVEG